MTSVLGQNDNNGSVVGPENNPTVDADQTTEITSSTTYTPIAPTGNVLVIAGGGGGGQNGGGGGGGGGAIFYPNYPMPGSDIAVVIGAGGASGNGNA